ncbi:hypothetical protein EYF80_051302 [Liparis tanakae]|uniref:Uncharacterized protein n=1 Tax=Liparis tanakae TaxID=230148 RepID=A0A4Z2FC62_9TELE|nr:hypothetical protein EYF80_051302 [Liparis tanakae]
MDDRRRPRGQRSRPPLASEGEGGRGRGATAQPSRLAERAPQGRGADRPAVASGFPAGDGSLSAE